MLLRVANFRATVIVPSFWNIFGKTEWSKRTQMSQWVNLGRMTAQMSVNRWKTSLVSLMRQLKSGLRFTTPRGYDAVLAARSMVGRRAAIESPLVLNQGIVYGVYTHVVIRHGPVSQATSWQHYVARILWDR